MHPRLEAVRAARDLAWFCLLSCSSLIRVSPVQLHTEAPRDDARPGHVPEIVTATLRVFVFRYIQRFKLRRRDRVLIGAIAVV